MNQKERYKAEIDAKLIKFGETLHDIKTKKQKREANRPDLQIDTTERKHEKAVAKLQSLDASDDNDNAWEKIKSEVDILVDDIDKELRKAVAYFG